MNKIHTRLFRTVFIIALLFAIPFVVYAHPGHYENDEALPVHFFKNLNAGKHQTVVVYGTSVSINGQWAKELESWFNEQYPGQVVFTNSAKAGMHSNWGAENLKERVLDKMPDLVFIEFSINDAATRHNISLQDSRHNLDTMVKALRTQNPDVEIVLQTMNPAWDSPESAPKMYASDRPHLEDYYKICRSYAYMHHLPLVDNYPVWAMIQRKNPENFKKMVPDGIHPGSTASREIAWPAVKDLLEKARKAAAQ